MAPEVCSSLPYSQQCDIWSCGIIMYLLLCNYRRECESLLQDMIIQGKIEFPEKYWASISDSAKDLIEHMLRFDPARRCSANEIKEHPWIRGESSAMTGVVPQTTVLELMKSYNAERRFKVRSPFRYDQIIKRLTNSISLLACNHIHSSCGPICRCGQQTSSRGQQLRQ